MRIFSKITILVFLAVFLVAGGAMAIPNTLYDITGITGTDIYKDTGAQGFTLSDTDGINDSATAFLLFEIAGFQDANTFGIYSYTSNESGVTLGDKLEIFNGPFDSVFDDAGNPQNVSSITLAFDMVARSVTNETTNLSIDIDPLQFGFYITTPEDDGSYIYYTHTSLNDDGFDHAMAFDTNDSGIGPLMGSDIVIAFEDLLNGGDQDFTDLVVGVTDITAAPVPEPATLFLLGSGLLGFAGSRRRKAKK